MARAVPRFIRLLLGAAVVVANIGSLPAAAAGSGSSGQTRLISASGSASFTAGTPGSLTGAGTFETPNASGDGGTVNRSHSASGGSQSVGAISQPKNVTTASPNLVGSFDGLNHFDQRWGSNAGGNQWSLEPPDQGLCVGTDGGAGRGNVRVVEVLNDVLQVYDTAGNGLAQPQALNLFLGYAPAIIRSTGTFGPFVTDPSCLYDATTGHWFLDVLTLDSTPHSFDGFQDLFGTNHLDLAVSNTTDPLGSWTVYRIPVQDDGTAGTPNHHCSTGAHSSDPWVTNPNACFGDYPHIGSNADGVFLTTNEYSFFGPEFHGAQVYAFSKSQLASTPATVNMTQIDTNAAAFGSALNGFTLWPSVTPTANGYGGGDAAAGGTEHFLSTDAAAEAHDTGNGRSRFQPSSDLLVWSLANTSSLGSSTPALALTFKTVTAGLYTLPPSSEQKAGNQPQRDCLNSNPCNIALNGQKDPFAEKSSAIDSNDTRMQQVTWVGDSLWGAIDTGLNTSNHKQAGIEWFKVSTSGGGVSLAGSGYVGLGNDNLIYPAIGITTGGTGVMAFTVVGTDFYPSSGYALINGSGVSDVHIAAMGKGPDDGFTDYRFYANPPDFTPRPRWGDYGAAVPWGGRVWLASEYIGQSCDFAAYKKTGFLCGLTRSALANWGTRITLVSAG